jgi:integrase
MSQRFKFYTQLGDGPGSQSIGYSTTTRDGVWGVRFIGPDGKRIERMTPCPKRGKEPDASFHVEADKIIGRVFAVARPNPAKIGWDDALDKVQATAPDLRPDTMTAYRKSARIVLATLEAENERPLSPSEITPALASLFARVWLGGTFTRSKATDAKRYKRRPTTLAFYLRQLSALWGQFLELGYAQVNPWKSVRKPNTDKVRKHVPTEDETGRFMAWVLARYPKWERLHALLNLKALSGCRSSDLCALRTNQLQDGRVVWTADQTKQRDGRAVLVPPELFAALKRLAGPVHLWEHWPEDLKQFRPSRNQAVTAFSTRTVFWSMGNIFREFANAHPDQPRFTPHALRRRAITLTVSKTQSVDATAAAIGLNPATARKYYLDSQRAFNSDEVFRLVAGAMPMPLDDEENPPTLSPH